MAINPKKQPEISDLDDAESSGVGLFSRFSSIGKYGDILFSLGFFTILLVMLFPVPVGMLDFLLSISIIFSILILLNVLFIPRPLDFSTFPTVLLIASLLRLSLNIATTRTILSQGHTGPNAAGDVINAFGTLVTDNNPVIGIIVFVILTIINFVVITKGSGRIAEVSARFSLDAMPGKQMAIDADLSSGLIDEKTARKRRKDIQDESTFYGAMDGASKFVRGDAIAGILITFINLVGGIVIGVLQRDLDIGTATQTYTILTVGDGLVSQIPSLIVSTAAGLLVTKSGVAGSADKAIVEQLGRFPRTLAVVSAISLFLGMLPVLPFIPFFFLSLVSGYSAYHLMLNPIETMAEKEEKEIEEKQVEQKKETESVENAEEQIRSALKINMITLELGYSLLSLINYNKGQKLTDQIKSLRTQIAKELGFIMPAVRIQDNMKLNSSQYKIKIKELEAATGEAFSNMLLVMNPSGGSIDVAGKDTVEPTFGLPAKWIDENKSEEASFKGYTVVQPPTVITTHLTEVIKENITELLTYSETQKLINELDDDNKKFANEVIPSQLSVSNLQKILQKLLSEGISIRDLTGIIEAAVGAVKYTQSPMILTEVVRASLARQITYAYLNKNGELPVVTLSSQLEQSFSESLIGQGEEKQLAMPPSRLQEFMTKTRDALDSLLLKGHNPVILVSPDIRPYVRAVTERVRSQTPVLSQSEVYKHAKINSLGVIG